MKTISELFETFKKMPLGKQSLIAVATITLIITLLANYKTIKQSTTDCIDKIVNDESVKAFMEDVNKLINSLKNVIDGFFKRNEIEPQEKIQLND